MAKLGLTEADDYLRGALLVSCTEIQMRTADLWANEKDKYTLRGVIEANGSQQLLLQREISENGVEKKNPNGVS